MKTSLTGIALVVLMACLSATAQQPEKFSKITFAAAEAKVEVVDGDTIWMGIHQVRLIGIDAVEPKQLCQAAGKVVDCHLESMNRLTAYTSRPDFRCEIKIDKGGKPDMSYGRYVGVCYSGGVEVNRAMVESGWAFAADKQAGDPYRKIEADAVRSRSGLHAMSVEKPWIWRKKTNSDRCN